jgi:hypothetical protein
VVPGITSILNRFKESGALINWAWRVGKAGEELRSYRDPAAAAGKISHSLIDAHCKRQSARVPTAVELGVDTNIYQVALVQGQKGFEGFKAWAEREQFVLLQTEFSLVSRTHAFGGILDGVCSWHGDAQTVIADWKLSSWVYLDHLLQLAAERELWMENHQRFEDPPAVLLLQIDKETGECTPHTWLAAILDEAFHMFKALRQAYRFDAKLQGVCREVAA